jgi:6,7-dimethyl-8-ribityllumazine synthase
MVKIHEGPLDSKGVKMAIIVSRFNEIISKKLLNGAVDALSQHGLVLENISVFWVPGAFEIPLTAKKIAQSKKFDAIVTLGAVIRGETPHFDQVADAVGSGVARLNLEMDIPIIFGVLTTDNLSQAINRSGGKYGNKGRESAHAALDMIGLLKTIYELN